MSNREKSTVLVVDDVPDNIDLLSSALQPEYRVLAALNGEKALKIALSENPPDLVLLDIMMPNIDGFQVLAAIREKYSAHELPVIMATARDESATVVKAMEGGANDYVTKPLDLDVVLSRVNTHVSLRRYSKAVADAKRLLDGVLDSTADAIVCVDTDYTLRVFNAAAERIFRARAGEVIGTPIDGFLTDSLRAHIAESLDKLKHSNSSERWVLIPEGLNATRSNGEVFPVEGSVALASIDGKEHLTVVLRDIHERLHAREQIKRLSREKEYLQEELRREHEYGHIDGTSPAIKQVLERVRRVAGSDASVLIVGESGTGKELVARAIHAASLRKDGPLVKVDCGALPEHLIESELFGHEKGSFTGAIKQRIGRFELADGGTLFLDEIGELPLHLQPKLLRMLQDQEFERIGGNKALNVDVRVIAATNRELPAMVADGDFREDLYYRLNVIPIELPPLRDRQSDIPELARLFLERYSRKAGRHFEGIGADAMHQLLSYRFPGNVRELKNIIERSVLLSEEPLLELDLGLCVTDTAPAEGAYTASGTDVAPLRDIEKQYIEQILARTGGVIEGPNGAAGLLGLNPSTLRFRLKKLGIRN